MRHRNSMMAELENLEGNVKRLKSLTNQPKVLFSDIFSEITVILDRIENLKSLVEREPISPEEMNPLR
jgi:hypothetical protein